jgi:hypothetical protein
MVVLGFLLKTQWGRHGFNLNLLVLLNPIFRSFHPYLYQITSMHEYLQKYRARENAFRLASIP